jgi:hypothetical protein
MTGRARDRIGRAGAMPAHARPRCFTHRTDALLSVEPQRQITSSKHPEAKNHDRTRLILSCFSLRATNAYISVRHV